MHGEVGGSARGSGSDCYIFQRDVLMEFDLMGRNALIIICRNISRWAIRMIHLLLALIFLCVAIVILSVTPPRKEKMEKPFSV